MMTDLAEDESPAAARVRRTSARDKPPTPRAPTLRKLRRLMRSHGRCVDPRKVSIGLALCPAGFVAGPNGRGLSESPAGLPSDISLSVVTRKWKKKMGGVASGLF